MARSILVALVLLMAALNAGASSELSDTETDVVNNAAVATPPIVQSEDSEPEQKEVEVSSEIEKMDDGEVTKRLDVAASKNQRAHVRIQSLKVQEIVMLEPRARLGQGQCEATSAGPKMYLSESGGRSLFTWRVMRGDPSGMCTVRMGSNLKDLKIIKPKNIGNSDGSFPCGRQAGFESKEFRLPKKACVNCFLELEWSIPSQNNTLYYCADMQILDPTPMPETFKFGGIVETDGSTCAGVC